MSVTKAVHVDVRLVCARGNADLAVTGGGNARGHNNGHRDDLGGGVADVEVGGVEVDVGGTRRGRAGGL